MILYRQLWHNFDSAETPLSTTGNGLLKHLSKVSRADETSKEILIYLPLVTSYLYKLTIWPKTLKLWYIWALEDFIHRLWLMGKKRFFRITLSYCQVFISTTCNMDNDTQAIPHTTQPCVATSMSIAFIDTRLEVINCLLQGS